MDKEELEIMQKRYEWMRNEILMRLEYRYKLTQLLLAFIPASFTFIIVLNLYYLAFGACFIVAVIAILFYAENRTIVERGDYLREIERFIDCKYKLPVLGWERYSRDPNMRKVRATRIILFAFNLLFFISYSSYNFMGCYYLQQEGYTKIILYILLEIPILLTIIWSYNMYENFFKI